MWKQWRKATNYIRSVQAYGYMSPDLAMRHRVNQFLRQHRQPLSPDDWCNECHRVTQSQRAVPLFLYHALAAYSGIEFNRVRPHDRLVDDLQFPLVCWFDWSTRLCNDVISQFEIDISECFDETRCETVADLIAFLDACLANKS
ncbi:MAG: hypothetical protein F6K31_41670 [Symploca sp. SIO2G7]|nr:hypothetical protein [Symploca sp. SIO2G7]